MSSVFGCQPLIGNSESVYKIIELVGSSTESWEKAAAAADELAGKSLQDLRIAEVTSLDMQVDDGKVITYRAKIKVSLFFSFRILLSCHLLHWTLFQHELCLEPILKIFERGDATW